MVRWAARRLVEYLVESPVECLVESPVQWPHNGRTMAVTLAATLTGTLTGTLITTLTGANFREMLVRDAAQLCTTWDDVEKVSGETMTETMTIGGKNEKRDTTHRRIALRVAPPGLEPGLS